MLIYRPKESVSDKHLNVEKSVHDFLQMEATVDGNFRYDLFASGISSLS